MQDTLSDVMNSEEQLGVSSALPKPSCERARVRDGTVAPKADKGILFAASKCACTQEWQAENGLVELACKVVQCEVAFR